MFSVSPLAQAITGRVTIEDRTANSTLEDVVINTITANQSLPQNAVSNINIYVPDKLKRIDGKQQYVQDRERLAQLVAIANTVIESANLGNGIDIYIQNYATIQERAINQHCGNIRIAVFIARPEPNN